jgi:hypothetical protein
MYLVLVASLILTCEFAVNADELVAELKNNIGSRTDLLLIFARIEETSVILLYLNL